MDFGIAERFTPAPEGLSERCKDRGTEQGRCLVTSYASRAGGVGSDAFRKCGRQENTTKYASLAAASWSTIR